MRHSDALHILHVLAFRPAGRRCVLWLLPLLAWLGGPGCAVPQKRGEGELSRIVEPTSKRGYWLYLPKDYVEADQAGRRARRWPLVVTFHGMKPFDNARPQACEWQQEADRYGFVVVAPELKAPDMFGQFPVRTINPPFKSDEEATLAILDHVFANTDADPSNVLATSWSSGGYTAHYMLNRHPDRFTCLAVRQSNFSASVLDPEITQRSRYHPILIIYTQNDFSICKRESAEGVRWYETHGYENQFWVLIKDKGHERTPDLAAEFFGRVAGLRPNRPPEVLVQRQAIDGNAEGLALLAGKGTAFRSAAVVAARPEVAARSTVASTRVTAGGDAAPTPPRDAMLVRPQPAPSTERDDDARAARATEMQRQTTHRSPVSIHVSSAIAIEPLHVGFRAICPSDWTRTADFLWTLDGEPVCSGVNGHLTLSEPKKYTLGLLVVTAQGKEYRAYRKIRVLPRLSAASYPKADAED
ncbi:MAG TPA: prolyl oligopeptidase family serine peptidase [Phycisphaerae bacterium]|nr:prolyl oligopeptidase family serine peptidase [Phycisphaerae bacterium]